MYIVQSIPSYKRAMVFLHHFFCNRTMHERLRCFLTIIVIINGTRFTSHDVERFVLSFDILKSKID